MHWPGPVCSAKPWPGEDMAGSGGDEGSGGMMKAVVFVAAFLAVVLFLMTSLSPILTPGNTTASNQP